MNEIYAAILGYVFGSVPFGLILTKAAGYGDVRNIGSGNIGATNVLRTGNRGIAGATLLCDILKLNQTGNMCPAIAPNAAKSEALKS